MLDKSKEVLELLRRYESRNVTYIDPDGTWPIVWKRAKGNHVWDVSGKRYLDLTAAFGVAAAGHGNAQVVRAGRKQMGVLLHAMGDVHPHRLKAELARDLSQLTFERWLGSEECYHQLCPGKTIFCNSGFEAVEAALKTAMLATGRPGVVAFRGGYHGVGYGALNATERAYFRQPFLQQLGQFGQFLDFPDREERVPALERALRKILRERDIGAVLVEPIQTRGGINVAPNGFLKTLRQACDQSGALLILDEIYTGFGRTGRWFACEHWGVVPDLICLGKALTGGFPLSACVGKADIMDRAWPPSAGEAMHTSTFLGHPVGCAMALAQIAEIRRRGLPKRAALLGKHLLRQLQALRAPRGLTLAVRGLGLLVGLDLKRANGEPATAEVIGLMKSMLQRGFVMLPEGEHSQVLSLSPPLTIAKSQLDQAVSVLKTLLELSPSRTKAPTDLNRSTR